MKTDKPPKGVTARRVSQILIFPPPKSGLNSFQSFCSGARDESFITTYSLINAWNRTRLLLIRRTSDFRLKQTVSIVLSKKAAELSGVAGEFCCHSLHRSKISKDL